MKSSSRKTLVATVLIHCLFLSTQVNAVDVNSAQSSVSSVIAAYRTNAPAAQVEVWKAQITHPSGNPRFKEFQSERLREWEKTEFAPYRVEDPEIVALAGEVIKPILQLYRRQDCFKILVIDHRVPVAMNDSGVLLMLSTGLIERATSDDEILGHVAHELGHDIYWKRTAQDRQILELYQQGSGTELLAKRAQEDLAKIELECDAFSAITMAALGHNPKLFGQYLLSVGRDFADYVPPDLPPLTLRAAVITGVVPENVCQTPPHISTSFLKLKARLHTAQLIPLKKNLDRTRP